MEATVLAESPHILSFLQAISAKVMSTDVS